MTSQERYTFIIDPHDDKSFKVEQLMNRINTVETSDLKLNYHNECIDFDSPCSVILEQSDTINSDLSNKAEYVMRGRVLNIGPSKYLNISFGGLIGQFSLNNPTLTTTLTTTLKNQISKNQISKNKYFLYIVKDK